MFKIADQFLCLTISAVQIVGRHCPRQPIVAVWGGNLSWGQCGTRWQGPKCWALWLARGSTLTWARTLREPTHRKGGSAPSLFSTFQLGNFRGLGTAEPEAGGTRICIFVVFFFFFWHQGNQTLNDCCTHSCKTEQNKSHHYHDRDKPRRLRFTLSTLSTSEGVTDTATLTRGADVG